MAPSADTTAHDNAIAFITNFLLNYGMELLGAVIILIIGSLFARWLGNFTCKQLNRREMEPPVRTLLVRMVRLIVMAATLFVVLDKCGVSILPMLAGVSVVGVGVGLAMQGVLSNVVAGLTIIFTKPFRVGEYIELLSVHGQVDTIELFTTVLIHPDRSRVIVPNRKIVGEILHNYGKIRQLGLSVGISYDADAHVALALVREVLAENPRVLKDPAPVFGIQALEESAIILNIAPWTRSEDFGPAQAELYDAVLASFRRRGIEIPCAKRHVRLFQGTSKDALTSPTA